MAPTEAQMAPEAVVTLPQAQMVHDQAPKASPEV